MQNASEYLTPSLEGSSKSEWLAAVEEITEDAGYYQALSDRHSAAFVDAGRTLLVTFETIQSISALSEKAHPVGWDMVREHGWSHLGIFSDGRTWFRDAAIYRYFDRMIDDGFFEDFDNVIFYGAGHCGYAACAYSVASPGAKVLALSPQATLDPRVTEWDDRYRKMRRVNFRDRYGYAPDMLDAAAEATIIYDPKIEMDAMHAALFTRPNVTKLRMPHFGSHLDVQLVRLDILTQVLSECVTGEGNEATLAQAFPTHHRERRHDRNYLRALAGELEDQGRWLLAAKVYRHASETLNAPRFRRRLEQIEEMLAARDKVQAEVNEAALAKSDGQSAT